MIAQTLVANLRRVPERDCRELLLRCSYLLLFHLRPNTEQSVYGGFSHDYGNWNSL
jgi:hypothetical protein